jgi:hypothetical protein
MPSARRLVTRPLPSLGELVSFMRWPWEEFGMAVEMGGLVEDWGKFFPFSLSSDYVEMLFLNTMGKIRMDCD